MTRKTLIIAATALGMAVSLGSAPSFAQSTDVIYLNVTNDIKTGRRALRKGNMKRAIVLFERGLKQNIPAGLRVVGHSNLCVAYRLQRDYEAAKENCDRAIALNPRYWRAYNNRANIYHDQENYLAALSDYEAALEINPKADVVRQNLRTIKTSDSMAD